MTQDIRQWLAEIKLLQQRLADAHQERDEAYAGAANWRKVYETEAQQRRTEANLARQTIDDLKAEIQRLNQISTQSTIDPPDLTAIQKDVDTLGTVDALKSRLVDALAECDRLTKALRAEQADHIKTRKELTVALGDTVDLLTKERAARQDGAGNPASSQGDGDLSPAKTPSLELPPLDPAGSLA